MGIGIIDIIIGIGALAIVGAFIFLIAGKDKK